MFTEEHLKHHSNYKIGGKAAHFFSFRTIPEAIEAAQKAKEIGKPIFILGGGTNILFGDKGWDGVVLKNEIDAFEVLDGNRLRVGGGVPIDRILKITIERGLSGLEWAGGLPGTLGGAIRGNAGAFMGETKDSIVEVTSLRIGNGESQIVHRDNKECTFAYRSSVFKTAHPDEIVLEATLQFTPGNRDEIEKAIQEKIEYRKTRHPIDLPNIGSIFKNIDLKDIPEEFQKKFAHVIKKDPFPVLPTAFLISEAGLKGTRHGGAEISGRHPNFIVNTGNATASDVKYLIALVKKTIKEKFHIDLEEEIVYIER